MPLRLVSLFPTGTRSLCHQDTRCCGFSFPPHGVGSTARPVSDTARSDNQAEPRPHARPPRALPEVWALGQGGQEGKALELSRWVFPQTLILVPQGLGLGLKNKKSGSQV